MNILLVSRYLPYPSVLHTGGIYIFRLVESLNRRGHQVSVLSFVDPEETAHIEQLRPFCQHIESVPLKRSWREKLQLLPQHFIQPPYVVRCMHPAMRKAIRHLLDEVDFDLVQVEYGQMGQYVNALQALPTVLDEIDVSMLPIYRIYRQQHSPLQKMWKYWWWKSNEWYEPRMCGQFDLVLVRSEKDRQFLLARNPSVRAYVLNPWVDNQLLRRPMCPPANKDILFVGHMGRRPNADATLWFYQKVLPTVLKHEPEARLHIVGTSPLPSVQALSQDDHVVVTGRVGQIEPYYEKCRVFIAPLLAGGGIIKKVLDAMAIGCPAVSTTIGVEGIGAQAGRDVLVSDSAPDFAQAVIRLLNDNDLWMRVADSGRQFIRQHYDWDATVADLEKQYEALIAKRSQKA